MNMTRTRDKENASKQSRKAIREAYDRKLQRELAREEAKLNGGPVSAPPTPGTPGSARNGQFYDVCKTENETGGGNKAGKKVTGKDEKKAAAQKKNSDAKK